MNLFIQEDWIEHHHCGFNVGKAKSFAKKENKRIKARAMEGWSAREV